MLALAHHVERLVESGELSNYAAAARALRLTRARFTQVLNLLLLTPIIQERLLLGALDISERRLRAVCRESCWENQAGGLRTPCPRHPESLPTSQPRIASTK